MLGMAPRNMLVEYESLKKLSFFREDMNMYEDFELCMRLCKDLKCAYSPVEGLEYRIHTTGAHTQATERHISNLTKLVRYFDEMLDEMPKERRIALKQTLSTRIAKVFPDAKIRIMRVAPSCTGKELIFLVSQPRAGSTMTQLLLAGHPDIATTSEPWVALHPLYAFRRKGIGAEYNSYLARMAVREFLRLGEMDEDVYMEEIGKFLLALYRRQLKYQGKKLFLDKTPRYYYILDDLIRLYPEAKFILLYRNPLAVFKSILKTWVNDDWKSLSGYVNDLFAAPGMMLAAARDNPGRCHAIRYEDLIKDTRGVLSGVCSYLGVAFEETMLDYSDRMENDWKFGDTVGIYKAAKPRTDSREGWKNAFVAPQERFLALSYLEALGADVVNGMGYDYNDLVSSVEPLKPGEADGLISWEKIKAISKGNLARAQNGEDPDAERQLRAMRESLSWKITAPLRSAASVIMKSKPTKRKK